MIHLLTLSSEIALQMLVISTVFCMNWVVIMLKMIRSLWVVVFNSSVFHKVLGSSAQFLSEDEDGKCKKPNRGCGCFNLI